jgi:hypothetical protein
MIFKYKDFIGEVVVLTLEGGEKMSARLTEATDNGWLYFDNINDPFWVNMDSVQVFKVLKL